MRNIKKKYKLWGRTDTVVKNPGIFEKWKEIGMEFLFMGIESVSNEYLKKRNKKNSIETNEKAIKIIQNIGIEIIPSFIIDQDFIKTDFEAIGDYIEKFELKQPVITILTPLPGTELFKRKKKELTTNNYELFDLMNSVLPTKLPLDEFYRHYFNLYKRAYKSNCEL